MPAVNEEVAERQGAFTGKTGLSAAGPEPVVAIPLRFWWLKRLAVAGGCLLVGLAALRGGWGWEAHRRYDAAIERYRQAGGPVFAAEFDAQLDAVPDEDNAALLLEQAIWAITPTTPSGLSFDLFLEKPELFDQDPASAQQLMAANANVFALVRQARAKPKAAWNARLQGYPGIFNVGPRSGQRQLSKLLWFSGMYHHNTGNDAEAVATMRDALALSEAVEAHPTLISNMTAWAICNLGIAVLEATSASLIVEGMALAPNEQSSPSSRDEIKELITALLTEERTDGALTAAFYGERAFHLEYFDAIRHHRLPGVPMAGPSLPERAMGLLCGPMVELDAVRAAEHCTKVAELSYAPNWPMVAERSPVMSQSAPLVDIITRPLSGIGEDSETRCIEIHFRTIARRRMAATALAIRLYVLDQGRRPETLTQLTPEYLDAVPLDPFSADGAALVYRPDASPPVLYSVGVDGRDNGGVQVLLANHSIDIDRSDVLFFLEGKPGKPKDSPPSTSTETGDDNQNTQDDGGQANDNQAGQDDP